MSYRTPKSSPFTDTETKSPGSVLRYSHLITPKKKSYSRKLRFDLAEPKERNFDIRKYVSARSLQKAEPYRTGREKLSKGGKHRTRRRKKWFG